MIGRPTNPAVRALLPFDLGAVDAAVVSGAHDTSDPVFTKGSVENQAARFQAEQDMLDAKRANARTFRELNDAADAERQGRIAALGGAMPMSAPSGANNV